MELSSPCSCQEGKIIQLSGNPDTQWIEGNTTRTSLNYGLNQNISSSIWFAVGLFVFLGWGLYNIMAESCAHESCHFKSHDHKLTRKGHYCPPFILQNYDDNIGLPDRDARSCWVAMFVCL